MSTNGAVCASAATATRFARDRGAAAAASTEDARRDDLGVVGVDDARSVHSSVYPSRTWSPLAKHATVSGNRMTAPGATFFAARRTGPTHTNGFPGGSGIGRRRFSSIVVKDSRVCQAFMSCSSAHPPRSTLAGAEDAASAAKTTSRYSSDSFRTFSVTDAYVTLPGASSSSRNSLGWSMVHEILLRSDAGVRAVSVHRASSTTSRAWCAPTTSSPSIDHVNINPSAVTSSCAAVDFFPLHAL